MTLQTFAAVAAVVDLAVIVSACVAGFLLARGTRLPGWAAAAAMLLIARSIVVTTSHLWATPAGGDSFPVVVATIGVLAATGITAERWRSRAGRRADVVDLVDPARTVVAEAHADAA